MSKYICGSKIKQIYQLMNIFVIKYLNIFEYPNIRYTLLQGLRLTANTDAECQKPNKN